MKPGSLVTLAFSLWMASCTASSEPSTRFPEFHIPVSTRGPTQQASPTSLATPTSTAVEAATSGSFELIGHSALLERGMNAGLAVYGKYAYIGSRTDGSHRDAGVLVLNVSDPSKPEIVYQIGPPEEGLPGQTSRELRVWPDQELLLVLNFNCEPLLHHCEQSTAPANISFYDISPANASQPRLVARFVLGRRPHEMFLWDDPFVHGRALVYLSTPDRSGENLLVLDISQARAGLFKELETWSAPVGEYRTSLHSLSVSVDGRRGYLAHLQDGFMILDTSDLAEGVADPEIVLLTPPENWTRSPAGAHSAVKLYAKPYVLITEEIYGRCPWGWTYVIDISDESEPQFVAEYKLDPYNTVAHCEETSFERYQFTSFSSHNPTVTKNMAFISWHSAGLQAISIEDPLRPTQMAAFLPEPLPSVETEDPALSSGPDKVVMWSYPIIKDGLIYVVDIRNGLYILKYQGPFEAEVGGISFLEGNSNLGEAKIWETP